MYLTCESKEGYKDGISNIIANSSMYQGCDDHECGVEDGECDDNVPRRRHRVREVVVCAAHRARVLEAEEVADLLRDGAVEVDVAVALEENDHDDGDHGRAEDDGVGHAVERVDPPAEVLQDLCTTADQYVLLICTEMSEMYLYKMH